jgi:hypothetical protein
MRNPFSEKKNSLYIGREKEYNKKTQFMGWFSLQTRSLIFV